MYSETPKTSQLATTFSTLHDIGEIVSLRKADSDVAIGKLSGPS